MLRIAESFKVLFFFLDPRKRRRKLKRLPGSAIKLLMIALVLVSVFSRNSVDAETEAPHQTTWAQAFEAMPEPESPNADLLFLTSNNERFVHRARDSLSDSLLATSKITITNQAVTGLTYDDFAVHFKVANPSRIKIYRVGVVISDNRSSYRIFDDLNGTGLITSRTLASTFSAKKYKVPVKDGVTYSVYAFADTSYGTFKGSNYTVTTPALPSTTSNQFLFPLTQSKTWWSSTYVGHGKAYGAAYSAVDIVLANGQSCQGYDVYASQDGIVVNVNSSNGQVTIRSDKTLYTLNGKTYSSWYYQFAHMTDLKVKEGDAVKQGQVVGKVGKVGNATGYHLHFQIMSAMNGSPWYANNRDKAISPYYVCGFVDQNGNDLRYNICDRQGTGVTNQLINWKPTGK